MVTEINAAHGHSSSGYECQYREHEALEERKGRVRVGGMGDVTEEEEAGQCDGEEGHELCVGGRHSVALAMHF